METINVRKAIAADLPVLLEFEQGVIAAERPFDPTLKNDPIHYYQLEQMLTDPAVRIAVAEFDNQLIASGYARIEQAKPYFQHQAYAYLGFMFVHPKYRGKGINGLIIQDLQEWAASSGVNEWRLEVYTDNIPAIKAYERIGFKSYLLTMRMANPES